MGFSVAGSRKYLVLVKITLTLRLLTACTSGYEVNANISTNDTANIINGKKVQDGSVFSKNAVLLINRLTSEVCTATLLGGNFALTAAHCLDNENPGNLYLFFGAKPNATTERRQVVAMKASPYWELRQKETKNTGDIAVIKFDGEELPKGYAAAEVLADDSILVDGLSTVVLGYGVSDAVTTAGAGILRMATLPILDSKYSDTEILLDQNKGSSICHGDSGGPAYVRVPGKNGKKAKYYVWGVSNRGVRDIDNNCQNSVAYTNVVVYLVWIQNTLKTL